MIAGVIRLGPSHDTPAYGSENVSAPIAARYEPASTSSNANVPFGLGLRPEDAAAAVVAELDRDPRQPELLLLRPRPACLRPA